MQSISKSQVWFGSIYITFLKWQNINGYQSWRQECAKEVYLAIKWLTTKDPGSDENVRCLDYNNANILIVQKSYKSLPLEEIR